MGHTRRLTTVPHPRLFLYVQTDGDKIKWGAVAARRAARQKWASVSAERIRKKEKKGERITSCVQSAGSSLGVWFANQIILFFFAFGWRAPWGQTAIWKKVV